MTSESVPSASPDTLLVPHAPCPILIVDDEPTICDMLRDILEEAGFPVVTAPTGQATLVLLQRTRVALVLMDFMMPGMHGLELADQLRHDPHTADIPLLLMSAVPPSDVGTRFLAVLPKPFALDQVVQLVRQFSPC